MISPIPARTLLLVTLVTAIQVAGCSVTSVPLQPIPTEEAGLPAGPTSSATESPVSTVLPPATALATVAAAETPTATARVELPLPGARLARDDWWTVVRAPGLPDMAPAPDLGPNTHFVVATGNGGLNTLRAELDQPANAWLTGVPTGTLLVGTFLGLRRGDGHDVEIVDLAVDGDTVQVAVAVSAPGEWVGSETVFPVHLVGVSREALPPGPLAFRFLDAAALEAGDAGALFEVTLEALDPADDGLRRSEMLILQSASDGVPAPAATP